MDTFSFSVDVGASNTDSVNAISAAFFTSDGAVLFTVSTDYTTKPVVWDSVLPASTAALASYAQAVALSYIGLSTNALTLHW